MKDRTLPESEFSLALGQRLPHHEGTWPHSAAAIERTMSGLSDDARAKVLGLNAARLFNFEVPARYRSPAA